MGKLGVFGIFLVMSLFLISSVSAQQPSDTQTNININIGLQIEFTQVNFLKNGKSHLFNAHVFNISTGERVSNSTTDCTFHLFDNLGEHQIDQVPMTYSSEGLDWDYNVTGNNFTRNGDYSFLVVCNSSNIGGFLSKGIVITQTGEELLIQESILYIFLSIFVMFLFLLSLFLTFKTPYSHTTNETGEIIKLARLKYVKLGLIMLDYILMVWVLNTLIGISENFLTLTLFAGFVGFLFQTLNNLALPFGVFIIVLSLFEIIRDTKIQKIINQLGSYRPSHLK